MNEFFHRLAVKISARMGSPIIFLFALLIILVWTITGPIFNFSDTWQLVINTGTTIVTFLMVFLIQNTQNRDAKAMQLKLDELLRASRSARDDLIDLEELTDEEIRTLDEHFRQLHQNLSTPNTQKLQKSVEKVHQRRGFFQRRSTE